ncbi:gamma-tubulin complex component 4 isoform X2 [Dendroctonus ponderosae]|uniref:Gamma-tubulin complex component n=1 Tax=Dendroctonus ponderosae TaxID=77166 RepID=A0AAR5PAY3_DENPD|nr:gamma-tubulin complex component 4 isoform X2 [Dendroctonus ponderosae]
MIHELLFNLWNNPGNTVVTDDSDWRHLFELPQFLHPGEESLLQLIMQIGMDYHRITTFTNQVLYPNSSEQAEGHNGVSAQSGFYLKAFCNGVQEVLEDYRKEIISLEGRFLDYPQLSLTYILGSINKYKVLFSELKSMIYRIRLENLQGCLLMSGLHKYTICGIDQIKTAADRVIKSVNVVFYQHLRNWIIYGDLLDPFNEFFICDGQVSDENFLYPEQLALSSLPVSSKRKIRNPPPVRKFYINWDLVPSFISEDSAESILFMGRIVWIIRNQPKNDEYAADLQTKFRKDIWEGKDREYCYKIQALCEKSFNAINFRMVIEECRTKLTKTLWSIMLKEGNLVQHLHLIREYFALGRGELFQQFLAVADANLKDIEQDSLMAHLNTLFHDTARKIYGENDKNYLRFELSSSATELLKTRLWHSLQLNFQIEWPLHIFFHPEVMIFYNRFFCFLLRLKKTQINLFNLWSNHTFSKQKISSGVWALRHNLMFLVNNLQYYMQVNVVETHFSILLKAVKRAGEFEDIIKIHHEFVTNLLVKSFVLEPEESQNSTIKHRLYQLPALQHNVPSKVYNVIIKLLELCDEFCATASTWNAELTEPELQELRSLEKRAEIAIETLLLVLYTLHKKVSGGHLLQLLFHLDFNRYFSKNKADLNLSAAFNMY